MKTRPAHIFIGLILAFVAIPVLVMFASTAGKAVDTIKDRFEGSELPVMAASSGELIASPTAELTEAPAATDLPLEKTLPEGLAPSEIGLPPQDMALSAVADKQQAAVGDTVTYYFTLTNYGTEAVPSVTFANDLPVELASATAVTDRGTVTVNGQSVTADLGTMAPGEQALVTVTATVADSAASVPELVNIGVMAVGSATDDTSNNVAMVPVMIGDSSIASSVLGDPLQPLTTLSDLPAPPPPSDLSSALSTPSSEPMMLESAPVTAGNVTVTESSNIDQANIGENVVFTLDVSNVTTEAASNVILEKEVPATFEILSVETDKGSYEIDGNLVRINIGDMAPNSESLVTITTQIQSTALIGTLAETTTNLATDVQGVQTQVTAQETTVVNKQSNLPETGFAPGRVTTLTSPSLSRNTNYDMVLTIPVLGKQTSVWGISRYQGGWDLGYLFNLVGHLEGTVLPGSAGNSVLTGHVTNADGQPGIFADLDKLIAGDSIYLHANGKTSKYQVQSVTVVGDKDGEKVFTQTDDTVLTLLTCHDFDPATGVFNQRVVVTAKLIK